MSKRGAGAQGGEERYGGSADSGSADMADKPKQATAAQMAKRKIAGLKRSSAARSQSPRHTSNPHIAQFHPQPLSASDFSFGASNSTFGGFGNNNNSNNNNNNALASQQDQGGEMDRIELTSPGSSGNASATNSFVGFGQPQQLTTNGSSNGTNGGLFSSFGQQQPASNSFGDAAPSFGSQNGSAFGNTNNSWNSNTANSQQANGMSTSNMDGWAAFKAGPPATQSNGSQNHGGSVLSNLQVPKTANINFSQSFNPPKSQLDNDLDTDMSTSPEKAAPSQLSDMFNIVNSASSSDGASGANMPPKSGGDLFSRITYPSSNGTPSQAQMPAADNGQESNIPAKNTGDLFSRVTYPNSNATPKSAETPAPSFSFTPSANQNGASNLFQNQLAQTPGPSNGNLFQTPKATETPVNQSFGGFMPSTAPAKSFFAGANNNPFGAPATPAAPVTAAKPAASSNFFSQNKEQAKPTATQLFMPQSSPAKQPQFTAAPSLFTPATQSMTSAANEPEAAMPATLSAPSQSSSQFKPATAPNQASSKSTIADSMAVSESLEDRFRTLNEGLRTQLLQVEPDADYTKLLEYYILKRNQLNDEVKSAHVSTQQNQVGKHPRGLATPQHPPVWGKTPAPSDLHTTGPIPATEPSKKRRSTLHTDQDADVVTATQKRRKSNETSEHPKLAADASDTAKLFEATLDKSTAFGSFAPAQASASQPTPAESASKSAASPTKITNAGGFQPSASSSSAVFGGFKPNMSTSAPTSGGFTPSFGASSGASSGGFKPSLPASTPAFGGTSGGFKPTASPAAAAPKGFQPTFGAKPSSTPNFLHAFGQSAKKQEEDARKKARDEDFDSEDDDPEEWEKKYEEEQARKRAKIEAAAKGGSGFPVLAANKPAEAAKEKAKEPTPPASSASKKSGPFEEENDDAAHDDNGNKKNGDSSSDDVAESEHAGPQEKDQSNANNSVEGSNSQQDSSDANKPAEATQGSSGFFSKSAFQPSTSFTPMANKSAEGGLFSQSAFKPSTSFTPFKASAADSAQPQNQEAATPLGKSTFGQSTSSGLFGAKPAEGSPSKAQLFGQSVFGQSPSVFGQSIFSKSTTTGLSSETSQTPAGDPRTWQKGSPIKFGENAETPASKTPARSTLFGASISSNFANLPTPKKADGEWPARPGSSRPSDATNDKPDQSASNAQGSSAEANKAENGNGDNEEEANSEAQIENMTALLPTEVEQSDVLYHVEKAKAFKFEVKGDATTKTWNEKALGPVWLLKNKTTGKTRILLKVPPFGKSGMNFNLLNNADLYKSAGKRVMASFVDHIHEKDAKGPSQWYVQFGKEADAQEMGRLMKEQAAQQ